MALNYLSIPGMFFSYIPAHSNVLCHHTTATSVNVECIFSSGQLLLSHVHSCLSTQLIRALLCLGSWSLLDLVKDEDVMPVAHLPDIEDEEDINDGWDCIIL